MINLPCPLALCPLPTGGLCALWVLYFKTHPLSGKRRGPVSHIKDILSNQLPK